MSLTCAEAISGSHWHTGTYFSPLASLYESQPLSAGAYTLPDAARLLHLPLGKLRGWVAGVAQDSSRRHPAGTFQNRLEGRDRHIDFYTLIELFTVAKLRQAGLSMKALERNRTELSTRFKTAYPFALQGLLTDGKRVLKELDEAALLELDTGGQSSFVDVVAPFCQRLDFDPTSRLAARYFPMGREQPILVSPTHSFGRPVIAGTNLTTEAIANLVRGGDSLDDIASDFDLPLTQVTAAWNFETRVAA